MPTIVGLFLQFVLFAAASATAIIASARLLHAPTPTTGPGKICFATAGLSVGILMCLLSMVPMARLAVFSRMLIRSGGAVLLIRERNAHGVQFVHCLSWREIKEAFNNTIGLSLAQGEIVKEAMLVRISTLFSLVIDGSFMALAMGMLILASASMERFPPTSPASSGHVAFELSLILLIALVGMVPLVRACLLSAIMARTRGPFLFVRVWSGENRGRTWHVEWPVVKDAFDALSARSNCQWRTVSIPLDELRMVHLDVSNPTEVKIVISWLLQSGGQPKANWLIARQLRNVFGDRLEVEE